MVEARAGMMHNSTAPPIHPHMRNRLGKTPLMLNGGFDLASGTAALAEGLADAISFGASYLANPDLVSRYRTGSTQFTKPDFKTFYSPGEAGYSDCPRL